MFSKSCSLFFLSLLSLSLVVSGQDEDWKCRPRNFQPTGLSGCTDLNFNWLFCSSSEVHADEERDAAQRVFSSSLHSGTITFGVEKICAVVHGKPKTDVVNRYCSVLSASNSPCIDSVCAKDPENIKSKRVVFCCDFCEDQVNTLCEPIEGISMDLSAYCAPVIRSTVSLAQYMMPTCMRKPNTCFDPRTIQPDVVNAVLDAVPEGSRTNVVALPGDNEAAIIADDLSGFFNADVAVPLNQNLMGEEAAVVADVPAIADDSFPTSIQDEGSAVISDMPVLQEDEAGVAEVSAPTAVTLGNQFNGNEAAVVADSQDEAVPSLRKKHAQKHGHKKAGLHKKHQKTSSKK